MGSRTGRVQGRGADQPLSAPEADEDRASEVAGEAKVDGSTPPKRRTDLIGLGIVVLVVVIDQLTKHWALNTFQWNPRHIVWTLHFVVASNTGAAFSVLQGRGIGPAIALVAVVVVVIVVRTLRFVTGWPAVVGSALVVGGALGNLSDRLFRSHGAGLLQGAVVDWIDFGWWPVFNVADAAICVGAVLLGVAAFFAPQQNDAGPQVPSSEAS